MIDLTIPSIETCKALNWQKPTEKYYFPIGKDYKVLHSRYIFPRQSETLGELVAKGFFERVYAAPNAGEIIEDLCIIKKCKPQDVFKELANVEQFSTVAETVAQYYLKTLKL